MNNIAFISTFPNNCFEIYAKQMIKSFVEFMPAEVPLLLELDDDLLYPVIDKMMRPNDGIAVGWEADHKAFVERNKGKDHPDDYRKQVVRFCHKVFAIKRTLDSAIKSRSEKLPDAPRYLVWMDADVHITRPVTMEEIKKCLPKEGDAVAYLGRKDWDHSECGWLAFDLDNCGDVVINEVAEHYITDRVFNEDQYHDSWMWDLWLKSDTHTYTDLTEGKSGTEIWIHSPMADWSVHYKGQVAKQQLAIKQQPRSGSNFVIQTKNSIPDEKICEHIALNQLLIKDWVRPCDINSEEIVVVSAGLMLIAEDIRREKGKRIVAVKHALEPLKQAGITPWACILLDPRPHVSDFVKDPDKDVLWFVASQVNPDVTKCLLDAGCKIIGYHASVNAGEEHLISKQPYAIINGGSATATRGLFLLHHMGFRKLRLYGYDLCYPDKQDLNALDDKGQIKFLETSVGINNPLAPPKRCFWSEPQLIAQFEEMNKIIADGTFDIEAFGDGIIPYIVKSKKLTIQRTKEANEEIIGKSLSSYKDLI